ncbi:S8 family peptidase [Archaeoglobus profundus]|uniref:Peptidase S8 and S53 subtilisin kexin sedolisin n=1 Tax=Archaeoglobus profundus (strain DSM 5631 / JCM 9629 / NBRC 100127 / Av18) TaxID=572546 RepID=D2RHY7_ARCPA|nr:S8 family peptidase [Archaeoglobus profundus]ADB57912.1 peptidase S8 and S53 subtilisin kexin sedolisin [Archaeoglobus profundus DSM 5631]
MRLFPIFLILILAVYPAAAFDLSDVFKPIDKILKKLNDLFYHSDLIENLELFKANYEIINGVYVEKTSWSIISGSSVNFSDPDLRNLALQPEVGVIIQFKRLPDLDVIYRIAELLGAEVDHIDKGINAVIFKFVDKPKLKEFILQDASQFDVASVWLDFTTRVPERPNPPRQPDPHEIPERPPDNRTNNTMERHPGYRYWVGNPHVPVCVENKTVKEVIIERKQAENAYWNDKLIAASDVWMENITGRNVVIAILDTGVDENHPMLKGKVIGSISFVEGEDPHDYHGHGTHCAGIAAGYPVQINKDGRLVWVSGVAPNAAILNVKVLGKNGGGSLSSVIKGLDYVAQWHDKHPDVPIVVSMSLGTPFGNPSDPVCQKVNWLVKEKKIPVVVAAGNEFIVIDSPGLATYAITVAAVDQDGKVASFSGKGPGTNYEDIKPDIAAPGVKIPSARANTRELIEMSGTSMATPHVAGVIALLLESDPSLKDKPERIKELLQATAKDDPTQPEIWEGAGVVDAYAAVKKLPKRSNVFDPLGWIKALFGGG